MNKVRVTDTISKPECENMLILFLQETIYMLLWVELCPPKIHMLESVDPTCSSLQEMYFGYPYDHMRTEVLL